MKKTTRVFYFSTAIALLAGCSNDPEPEATDSEQTPAAETPAEDTGEEATSGSEEDTTSEPGEDSETEDAASEEAEGTEENDETNETEETEETAADSETAASPLNAYSSEQIEYARVWLQLGPNQDIDNLYVKQIPAKTAINPDDEASGIYPEDVIQLAGSRLVDGSVTYSGNGDGTINVYNVPLRWDGEYPAGENFYLEIVEDTELVEIDEGKDEEVIRLIELLELES